MATLQLEKGKPKAQTEATVQEAMAKEVEAVSLGLRKVVVDEEKALVLRESVWERTCSCAFRAFPKEGFYPVARRAVEEHFYLLRTGKLTEESYASRPSLFLHLSAKAISRGMCAPCVAARQMAVVENFVQQAAIFSYQEHFFAGRTSLARAIAATGAGGWRGDIRETPELVAHMERFQSALAPVLAKDFPTAELVTTSVVQQLAMDAMDYSVSMGSRRGLAMPAFSGEVSMAAKAAFSAMNKFLHETASLVLEDVGDVHFLEYRKEEQSLAFLQAFAQRASLDVLDDEEKVSAGAAYVPFSALMESLQESLGASGSKRTESMADDAAEEERVPTIRELIARDCSSFREVMHYDERGRGVTKCSLAIPIWFALSLFPDFLGDTVDFFEGNPSLQACRSEKELKDLCQAQAEKLKKLEASSSYFRRLSAFNKRVQKTLSRAELRVVELVNTLHEGSAGMLHERSQLWSIARELVAEQIQGSKKGPLTDRVCRILYRMDQTETLLGKAAILSPDIKVVIEGLVSEVAASILGVLRREGRPMAAVYAVKEELNILAFRYGLLRVILGTQSEIQATAETLTAHTAEFIPDTPTARKRLESLQLLAHDEKEKAANVLTKAFS